MTNVLAVIPARLASQRLPEKPLKEIAGKTLLERVWLQAKKSKRISRLVVGTDNEQVYKLARGFGAEVVISPEEISTGSQRVAFTAELLAEENRRLAKPEFDLIVNVQGDMPFLNPELIDACIDFHAANRKRFSMSTVATAIEDEEIYLSKSVVKVVVSAKQQALYFSRAPIPHSRDGNRISSEEGKTIYGYKHFGLYVFSPEALKAYTEANESNLEQLEKLEQLRVLEQGGKIGVLIVPSSLTAGSIEVDTAQDLAEANRLAGSK